MRLSTLTGFFAVAALAITLISCDVGTDVLGDDPTGDDSITEILAGTDDFSLLSQYIGTAGLSATFDAQGPFTMFGPVNSAVEALPEDFMDSLSNQELQDLMLYHVLEAEFASLDFETEQTLTAMNGQEIFVTMEQNVVTVNGDISVINADLTASNGFIHTTGGVLLPDAYGDVVDNAFKRYFLTALIDAFTVTELAENLRADGPFTLLAPDNAAFDEISDVLAALSPEELEQVLLYHVVPTRLLSTDFEPEQEIETLNGQTLIITIENETILINGEAAISTADINGTNGVVHVIDTVLLPEFE